MKYLSARLFQSAWALIAVVFFAFVLLRLIPGDPVVLLLGVHATPQAIAKVNSDFGLNKSILQQFFQFIMHVLDGDLGISILKHKSVLSIILDRLWVSVFLVSISVVVSLVISLCLGGISAFYKNRLPDQILRFITTIAFAVPSFWLGLMFILFFSLKLKMFPVGGYGGNFIQIFHQLMLPSLTISFYLSPQLIRTLRSSLIEALDSSYIEAARARGYSQTSIVTRSAMKNALIPLISVLSINIGFLFSGTVVVESVFQLPGLGALLVNSVLSRDYPVIQGLVIVFGVLVIFTNLLADVAYTIFDPRIRNSRMK